MLTEKFRLHPEKGMGSFFSSLWAGSGDRRGRQRRIREGYGDRPVGFAL
jgi:hypothetical protein